MIHHKKIYEDIYSTDRVDPTGKKYRLPIEKVSCEDMDLESYTDVTRAFFKSFYDDMFLGFVRASWLRKKFRYEGKKAKIPAMNGNIRHFTVFTKFLRRIIGHDMQIITKSYTYPKLETHYFDQLFPEFMDRNPFDDPDYYRFPYKFISLEYLMLIYQLDDRLELLEFADEKEMTFAEFMDFIVNHILAENERLGEYRYELAQQDKRHRPFFVRDNKKELSLRAFLKKKKK